MTPWPVACQDPLSVGFSRQEYRQEFLLQGIFATQGSNLGLLHCRQILELPGKSKVHDLSLWYEGVLGPKTVPLMNHCPQIPTIKVFGANTCMLSQVRLLATPWTIAFQAPLSVGVFRQEYWGRLPFSPLGDLPDPGIELVSSKSPVLAGCFLYS